MPYFNSFFLLENKRFLRRRNAIIFLILWVILAVFTIVGIYEYKDTVDRQEKFREIEALNFAKFPNYDIYGDEGISVQYCPSPLSILFRNMGISTELIGKVDSHVNISIFDNYKSRSLFRDTFSGIWSFAGIMFVFVSLLCLFWGAEYMGITEYLKFLTTLASRFQVFLSLVLSRILIITLILFFIFISMYILLLIFGVHLNTRDIEIFISYFVDTLLMLSFFFLIGVIIGIIRSKTGSVLAIMVVWILFVFLIPGFIQNIVVHKTFGSIRDYQTEIKKFKILADFEKKCFEKTGKYIDDKFITFREFAEYYWSNNYPGIESLEKELKNEIDKNIDTFGKLSLLTPSSIYYNTGIEISSRGYEGFSSFYNRLIELKKKFVRFYIDQFYYHNPKDMINFIHNNENLYFAQSRLPRRYGLGLSVYLLYFIGLLYISYYCFKRSLYSINERDMEQFLSYSLDFNIGKLNVVKVKDENLKNILFTFFSGEFRAKKFHCFSNKKIFVKGDEISCSSAGINFLYIPNGSTVPGDITVRNFIFLVSSLVNSSIEERTTLLKSPGIKTVAEKKFNQIGNHKKAEIMLSAALLHKSSLYFFFDIALGLSEDFAIPFKEKMETLNKEAVVIYFTTNVSIDINNYEENSGNYLVEDDNWVKMVELLKKMKKDK